jgi:hypothetical protein
MIEHIYVFDGLKIKDNFVDSVFLTITSTDWQRSVNKRIYLEFPSSQASTVSVDSLDEKAMILLAETCFADQLDTVKLELEGLLTDQGESQ